MRTINASRGNTSSGSADLARQVLTVVATAVTLTVNALANILPINGQSTATVSDKFPAFFVPAGYVFSIWGIIYIGLTAYSIYQALPSQRSNETLRRVGWLYIASCVVNSIWIFAWHYELLPLTLVLMLGLLALLVAIYIALDGRRATAAVAERWAVIIPFSIYLAWITVATIANATDLLYWLGWQGAGADGQVSAIAMLLIGAALTVVVAGSRKDLAYGAVIVWAFLGITAKQSDTPAVAITAAIMAGLVAVAVVGSLFLRPAGRATGGLRPTPGRARS